MPVPPFRALSVQPSPSCCKRTSVTHAKILVASPAVPVLLGRSLASSPMLLDHSERSGCGSDNLCTTYSPRTESLLARLGVHLEARTRTGLVSLGRGDDWRYARWSQGSSVCDFSPSILKFGRSSLPLPPPDGKITGSSRHPCTGVAAHCSRLCEFPMFVLA